MRKKKILVLVEGAKTDVSLMKMLFEIYDELDAKYEIVSYSTNIYVLYQEFFHEGEPQDSLDILQVLKAREKDSAKKGIFDEKYTDILLIFDLDPQDPSFSDEKILQLQEYFSEASDMGKLYINYPMVESFYHMPAIPDPDYLNKTVSIDELLQGQYKQRVNRESKNRNYRKFIASRKECNTVILQNIEKAFLLLNRADKPMPQWVEIKGTDILEKQLQFLKDRFVHVLCTCVLYIYDYNSKLLFQEGENGPNFRFSNFFNKL